MSGTEKAAALATPAPAEPLIVQPGLADKEESTTSADESGDAGFKNYLRIFTYADSIAWTLNIFAFAAAIAAGAALPLMDLIFGKFVTQFTNFATGALSADGYRHQVQVYSLYFVYLFIAKFVLVYIHTVCISTAAIRTTKALRIDFLRQLLRQNVSYFDSETSSSVAIQTTTNANNVNTGISEKFTLFIASVSTFVAAFAVAFAVQWKLTLITISIVPLILLVINVGMAIEIKSEARMATVFDKASLMAEEVFATMRTVHAFWLQPLLAERYGAYLDEAKAIGMKKSPNYAVLFSFEFFCTYSGYGLAFWQGIRMYASGEIAESGDVVTVIFAVIVAATAMTSISPQILSVTKAAGAAGSLFKVIDRKSEIDALSEDGLKPNAYSGEIRINKATFAYPSRQHAPVLQGLDLVIPAGKTTALVGASGSGKSTIIGLLERWYELNDGEILLDGNEIHTLNIGWVRTNIRLVQQEPVLFNGTIFDNVVFGLLGTVHVDLPIDQQMILVKQACKAAYADEFIERLPHGYQTPVGERAMMLSGGQKQRLAIARSIISDPKVLLLDEATSALDPRAEKIVQEALDNVSENRTTLVIAHKLSTVRNADNIAVMSKGAVIEQGTHDELIAADGAYARLVRAQDLGFAQSEAKTDDEDTPEDALSLVKTQTRPESAYHGVVDVKDKPESMRYSLLSCLWTLIREERELWGAYTIMFFVGLVGGAAYPVQAILFSRVITVFQISDPTEMVNRGDFWSLMFFILAIVIFFAYGLLGWFCNIISQTVGRRYRLELFERSLAQDMDYFDRDENGAGAIVSRLSSYPNNLLELMGSNIVLIWISIVNLVSSSILGIATGWKLGLATVFGALPPMLVSGWLRVRLEFKLDEMTATRFESSASIASEAIAAIRTVSSLTLERHILRTFEDRLQHVAKHSIRSLLWTMFWYSLTQSINFAAMALAFWYGGTLVSTGEYDNQQFFVVFTAVIFSGEAAAFFFSFTTSITKAQIAANHIIRMRNYTPSITQREGSAASSSSSSTNEKETETCGPVRIQTEDLGFSYRARPGARVIEDVSLIVEPGQFVALVGASGCGKSTMISLLERFYDPTTGSISRDGIDIRLLSPREYRSRVALVQQEPVLYQGSIRDNIAMGLSEPGDAVPDGRIARACQAANIYDFIVSLPHGFATRCGARGLQLSGGQRQRIAIARALVREPALLLLDEATSALDSESERIVQQALELAQAGRTTVAVAHRLATIKHAHCILVFRRGRVIERGTHQELLARRGVYYEMCLGQSLDQSVS